MALKDESKETLLLLSSPIVGSHFGKARLRLSFSLRLSISSATFATGGGETAPGVRSNFLRPGLRWRGSRLDAGRSLETFQGSRGSLDF